MAASTGNSAPGTGGRIDLSFYLGGLPETIPVWQSEPAQGDGAVSAAAAVPDHVFKGGRRLLCPYLEGNWEIFG